MIKKIIFLTVYSIFLLSVCNAQNKPIQDEQLILLKKESDKSVINSPWFQKSLQTKNERLQWWSDSRFGCLVVWGPYSPLGGEYKDVRTPIPGYAEQIMRQARIPVQEYKDNVVKKFNPEQFNAEEWCRLLSEAGMKYVVITAKFHDGFAMWDSDVNDYDIEMTPFKRDPIMELKKACDKFGLKFGFYYSQAQEWSQPYGTYNFWEFNHPVNRGGAWFLETKNKEHALNVGRYFDDVAIPHVLELSRKYDPAIFWFDVAFCAPQWENNKLLKSLRAANPDVIVNSRIGGGFGDYLSTNDKAIEFRYLGEQLWEGIPTINESYGYHQFDKTHKKPEELIEVIVKACANGGNTMLDVGPKGDGTIDIADQKVLRGIGQWMKINGESIYGAGYAGLPAQSWGQITRKGQNLYLHILQKPKDGKIKFYGLNNSIQKAEYLKTNEPLKFKKAGGIHVITVDDELLEENIPVIKLTFEGEISISSKQYIIENMTNKLHVFEAQFNGEIKYGSGQKKSEYISNWKDSDTYPEWKILVEKSGEYNIDVYYHKLANAKGEFGLYNNGDLVESFENIERSKITLNDISLKKGDNLISLKLIKLLGKEAGRLKYLVIRKK